MKNGCPCAISNEFYSVDILQADILFCELLYNIDQEFSKLLNIGLYQLLVLLNSDGSFKLSLIDLIFRLNSALCI